MAPVECDPGYCGHSGNQRLGSKCTRIACVRIIVSWSPCTGFDSERIP
jgi:hypothetical protein